MKKFLIGLLCLTLALSTFSFVGCLDVVKNPGNSGTNTESSKESGDKNEDSSSESDDDDEDENDGGDEDDDDEKNGGWTKPY